MAKLKWNQHPIEDDITYSGPLSYRHFKVIGWVLLILHMLVPIMKIGAGLDPFLAKMLATPLTVLELFTPLSVSFLLIASMSQLIVKGDYTKQMLTNGTATLGIILVFELFYHRYIVTTVNYFVGDRLATLSMINEIFSIINPVGFMTFNVFLDLFLCTCVMFFLNYEPRRFFVGERLKWFRCLVVLPIVYELACLWLKLMANSGDFHMPLSLFPFLTAKPPMMFFVFCAMVAYQLTRERRFCAGGRTHEEYQAYLGTNRDSWQFARFSAIICLVAGALDLIIVIVAIVGEVGANIQTLSAMSGDELNVFGSQLVSKYANAGFGGSLDLLFFAPIMLLFNYRKSYENTTIELAIPIVSVIALIIIYLEAGLMAMGVLASIVKEEVVPQIAEMMSSIESTGDEALGDASGDDIDAILDELLGGLEAEGDAGAQPSEAPAAEAPTAEPVQEAPAESIPIEPQQQPEPAAYQPAPAYVPRATGRYVEPSYAEPVYQEAQLEEEAYAPDYPDQPDIDSAPPSEEEAQQPEAADSPAPEQQEPQVADAPAPDQGAGEAPAPPAPEQPSNAPAPPESVWQGEPDSLLVFESPQEMSNEG